MPISRSLMIVGLLAAGLFLSPASFTGAQQGQTVSVRPRVTSSAPGMPEVKVKVDRNRVPLGEEVTFTVSPAPVVTDSRYKVTLFFGDDGKSVMSQPQKVHIYTKPGNYTYSILVEPASQQPKPTPPSALAIPSVKLTAAPTSVDTNRTVSFSAQLSHPYPNIRYRFVFGDGSASDWQNEANATHAYRSQGTYQAYVDLGVNANGSIKQASGSKRESIQVSEPSRPANVSVKLIASATSVNVSTPVTFTARLSSPQPNARYRFDFGDQTALTGWQANPQVTHRYKSAAKFSARADVRIVSRTGAQSASSNPVSIDVASVSGAKPTVDLRVIPDSVPLGVPSFFRAIPSAADSKTRYRFNFGDASSPTEWSSQPDLTHTYASPGAYSAFVEIGAAGDQGIAALAVSAQKRVRITPVGPADNTNGNSNTRGNANSNTTANTNTNGNTNGGGSPNSNDSRNANSNLSGNTNANLSGVTNGNANSANSSPSPLPSQTVSPTPIVAPTESSSDWWKYLIIIALIAFAGYQAASYFFVPRPTFVPHIDPGDADVGAGSLAIDLQVDVDPNVGGGEFTLDTGGGSLIKSERTES
jgi:hypothetical protein